MKSGKRPGQRSTLILSAVAKAEELFKTTGKTSRVLIVGMNQWIEIRVRKPKKRKMVFPNGSEIRYDEAGDFTEEAFYKLKGAEPPPEQP